MSDTAVPDDITRWLRAHDPAFSEALPSLFTALYAELKRRAHFALGRSAGQATLATTGLVNEAYLRLSAAGSVALQDRHHFLALASRTMRWVLLDTARARKQLRRGGDAERVSLEEAKVMSERRADELLALDQALDRLAAVDARLAEVVEHRFFGGLTVEDTALALGRSPRTVKRDWHAARAFLAREMGGADLDVGGRAL